MTKLADLIRRTTRQSPPPMGFAASAAKAPPTMLLLAIASDHYGSTASDAFSAGADAILLAGRPNDSDLSDAVAASGNRPVGVLSPDGTSEQIARLRALGVDFVMLEPEAAASTLLDDDATLLLRLKQELTDIQLRTLDAMPISALYVERESGAITIWRQMELNRVSGLARKPLALRAQPDAKESDLLALRESGVALLAVDMKDRDATATVSHLRSAIDALPARKRSRRDDRPTVTIPGARSGDVEQFDDDEDDE